jgi:beta-galactosidase
LLDAAPQVAAQAAILDETLSGFMLERGWYWDGPPDLRARQQRRAYRALRRCRINVDFTAPDQDWQHYRLLVVPLTVWADDALAQRLTTFVEHGGTLVTHPLCFVRNRESAIHPRRLHPQLEQLLGASLAEYATVRPGAPMPFRWRGVDYQGELFGDLPEVHDATVDGEYAQAWYAGTAAVLRRTRGSGQWLHVATIAEERFHNDLLASLVREAGIAPILAGEIPEEVELTERSGADGQRLIFAMNWSDRAVSFPIPQSMTDLLTGEMVGAVPADRRGLASGGVPGCSGGRQPGRAHARPRAGRRPLLLGAGAGGKQSEQHQSLALHR